MTEHMELHAGDIIRFRAEDLQGLAPSARDGLLPGDMLIRRVLSISPSGYMTQGLYDGEPISWDRVTLSQQFIDRYARKLER